MDRDPSPRWSVRRLAGLLGSIAALALVGAVGASPAAAASPGCTLEATDGTVTRSLGSRFYELHVPRGLEGNEVPLLLSLHGFGSNGRQDEQFTGWSAYANAHNLIVAYPNGFPGLGFGAWNPYFGTADVDFLRQVVDDIASRWCVDPRRVHVDGWSNGAVMSQRVACEAADRFASVTSYAGGTPTLEGLARPCRPSRPISVGLFVGQLDFTYAGLALNTEEWRGYNDCSATPTHSTDPHGTLDVFDCAAGTQVLARVVRLTSHNWPSGAKGEDQRDRMWAFFEAHPLP